MFHTLRPKIFYIPCSVRNVPTHGFYSPAPSTASNANASTVPQSQFYRTKNNVLSSLVQEDAGITFAYALHSIPKSNSRPNSSCAIVLANPGENDSVVGCLSSMPLQLSSAVPRDSDRIRSALV